MIEDQKYFKIKKELEDLNDFKIEEMQSKYEQLKEDSLFKINELHNEIDKLKQYSIGLELELGLKSRMIIEKERKIEEMNNFESRNFTIYRLKRMIKGLNDFIVETETEQQTQEKTLDGIAKILEIEEKLRKPPLTKSEHSQTLCQSNSNNLKIEELQIPLLSLSPLYHFVKPSDKFIMMTDQALLNFCEEVLQENLYGTYSEMFIIKAFEQGKNSQFLYEIIYKLNKLSSVGLKWPMIFRKLLGVDKMIIGKFFEFIKTLDSLFNSTKFLYFIDFECIGTVLYKIFKAETFKVHKILHEVEFFEPVENTKSFETSLLNKTDIMIMKLAYEVKKNNMNLKGLLLEFNNKRHSMVSRSIFVEFLMGLQMNFCEKDANELWDFVAGESINQIHVKSLLKQLNFSGYIEKSKNVYLDKFDLMLRVVVEWEKKQEAFLEIVNGLSLEQNMQDFAEIFKQNEIEVSQRTLAEVYLALRNSFVSIRDHPFESVELIQIPVDIKKQKKQQLNI